MESLFQKHTRAIKTWLGKIVDYDKRYANQCVDWVKQYAKDIGYPITTYGNAKDYARVGLGNSWVPTKTKDVGHIVVFTKGTYGHIAVVDKVIGNNLYTIEQNRDGKAYLNNNDKNFGSPILVGKHTMDGTEVFFKVKN